MVVTIHQPEHLPWLGFFDKLRQAEVYVMLDHVQFRKHYFQNRNRIRSTQGPMWLTVPVRVSGRLEQAILEVRIDNEGNPRWREKCWKRFVQCYQKAPHFAAHAPFFETLYRKEWRWLIDLNEEIIGYLCAALQIQVRWVRSSSLGVRGAKGELLRDICRAVGGTVYLSGVSGQTYLDPRLFAEAGIELRYQAFYHPVYPQRDDPFIPCLSAVDLLMNCGPASRQVLEGTGVQTLEHVFP